MPIDAAASVVKSAVPGSISFLIIGLVIAGALLFGPPRAGRWGRALVVALPLLYLLLSLQGTSDLLARGLRLSRPVSSGDKLRDIRRIVVLGNGVTRIQLGRLAVDLPNIQTGYNALEAARVYRLLDRPRILASGGPSDTGIGAEGETVAAMLVRLGVPAEQIDVESKARTTREQAVYVGRRLADGGESRFVLVTAPEHMRRAAGAFTRMNVQPVPSPSAIHYGGVPWWRPTAYALTGSRNACYEYLALMLYRLRGWI